MIDGLVLFQWTPDWRSWVFEDEVPSLKGKMALMPLPAWKPGGRRTSVWGGTGLMIMKATKNPELAWELAKFLYFDTPELGKRFQATNILPVLKDAWNLPEFDRPNPYWSNQPIGTTVRGAGARDAGRSTRARSTRRRASSWTRRTRARRRTTRSTARRV